MPALHPIHRRCLAEDLVRLRRADDAQRYLAAQRAGRIDPNPHQIDAVIFALSRLPEGGCILADEVGLGKTIEAGLVIAQRLAEGARRVLLVTPKPLLGQWRQELATLFGIDVREGSPDPDTLQDDGVVVMSREVAAGEKGAEALAGAERFDLCVIDEAHEVFAGIHRRYDRHGLLVVDSPHAKMAARMREVLAEKRTPVLLLTATPIQNSLAELWGLVGYVDPAGTLLGDLGTFREMFCGSDDRTLRSGQEHELRRRVATVCRRALRRQAQAFLERPFVDRRAQLFDYAMSPEERALYDAVTAYLMEPGICAFQGNHRRLLLIGFHRRMASSVAALIASLSRVADRLRGMLDGSDQEDAAVDAFAGDLEDDETGATDSYEGRAPDPEVVGAELARVEGFLADARSLPTDSKARALLRAVELILARRDDGEGSGKLVIFTESLATQDYLRALLIESGMLRDDDITLFRGTNTGARARAALAAWDEEVGATLPAHARPSRDIAQRLALVHEFATRSTVFLSTEAGAKGLNLQFCDTLVNYDLPWNPQRIEQRIGRCHRYGQERAVTVVSFLNRDNEAERLLFDILSAKLELFGTVLDASDAVLHEADAGGEVLAGALGVDFEARLRRIYEQARSAEEVQEELRALRDSMAGEREAFEATHRRMAGLVEGRLDESVTAAFRRLHDEVPGGLARFDAQLERLLRCYLDAIGAEYRSASEDGAVHIEVGPCAALPEGMRDGASVVVGRGCAEALHLRHPLVVAAVDEARSSSAAPFRVGLETPGALIDRRGGRGRLVLVRARYGGFEVTDRLLPVAVLAGEPAPLPADDAWALLQAAVDDAPDLDHAPGVTDEDLDEDLHDAVDEVVFLEQSSVVEEETERFGRALGQVERYVEDRVLLLEQRRAAVERQHQEAVGRRDGAVGAQARSRAERELAGLQEQLDALDAQLDALAARRDEVYRRSRDETHARRYRPPELARLLDVEFVLQ